MVTISALEVKSGSILRARPYGSTTAVTPALVDLTITRLFSTALNLAAI